VVLNLNLKKNIIVHMNNTVVVLFIVNSTVGTVHPPKKGVFSFKFQNPSRHQMLPHLLSFIINFCCYWIIR